MTCVLMIDVLDNIVCTSGLYLMLPQSKKISINDNDKILVSVTHVSSQICNKPTNIQSEKE